MTTTKTAFDFEAYLMNGLVRQVWLAMEEGVLILDPSDDLRGRTFVGRTPWVHETYHFLSQDEAVVVVAPGKLRRVRFQPPLRLDRLGRNANVNLRFHEGRADFIDD